MASHAIATKHLTANPGDIIVDKSQSIEEKAKQVAVDKYDITGSHITVPTYFVFTYPNGETKALHHVRDAKEISNLIRQMRLDEEDIAVEKTHSSHINGLFVVFGIFTLALLVMTSVLLVGVF
jgi:hypothetical protein